MKSSGRYLTQRTHGSREISASGKLIAVFRGAVAVLDDC